MAKASPEKLARALRENLKRRKESPSAPAPDKPAEKGSGPPPGSPKKAG